MSDTIVEHMNRLDRDCVGELLKFGREHFGSAWKPVEAFEEDLGADAKHLQLFLPWAVYMYEVDGATAAARYAETHGEAIGFDMAAWLQAQAAAHLSVLEVVDTQPGVGLTVRDQLTDATHFVQEPRASLALAPGHAVCARVVTLKDTSVFCGVHNVAMTAVKAAEMAQEVATALGLEQPPATQEQMRSQDALEEVLMGWEAVIEAAEKDAELKA